MTKVLVELNDKIATRLRNAAAAHGVDFEDYLRKTIESLPEARHDPFRSLNWDDALIDQILDGAMKDRETRPWRMSDDEDAARHGYSAGDNSQEGS